MKAIVQQKYGPADEVLALAEIDAPTPTDDEVLVRVHAASMHPDIWHAVTGLPYVLRAMGSGLTAPKCAVPGTDVAGRVEALGKNVTTLSIGDAVFGEIVSGNQWMNGGSYAERVTVRPEQLALKPDNVTFEQAATVPTTGLIALRTLLVEGQVEAGDHVLVNGAGGGVGTFAVQIAKALGATVTAVDRGDKLERLRAIGADHVVDYAQEDFTRGTERYDVVLDVASTLELSSVKRVLTADGVYVIVGHSHFEEDRSRWFGTLGHFFGLIARSPFDRHLPKLDFGSLDDGLEQLRGMVASGAVVPLVDRTFPLSEVCEAVRYMKEGAAVGRIVITVFEQAAASDPKPKRSPRDLEINR